MSSPASKSTAHKALSGGIGTSPISAPFDATSSLGRASGKAFLRAFKAASSGKPRPSEIPDMVGLAGELSAEALQNLAASGDLEGPGPQSTDDPELDWDIETALLRQVSQRSFRYNGYRCGRLGVDGDKKRGEMGLPLNTLV